VAPCDECGFSDANESRLGSYGARYEKPLTRFLPGEDPDVVLRTRPEPGVWSALEYTAHVRDVFDFYRDRVERALTEDRPQYGPLDPDVVAEERRYNEEDPAQTIAGLAEAERAFVDLLDGLDDARWERVGIGIDGDERTVRVLSRRAEHDAHHHMLDVGRVLRRVREAAG
jgi:hypothetical protein